MTRAKKRREAPRPQPFPLNRLLRERGFTKYKFARASGIPHSMLVRLAKPEANPNWKTVLKIVRALDCRLADLDEERRPA